jgi:hypothetical protein
LGVTILELFSNRQFIYYYSLKYHGIKIKDNINDLGIIMDKLNESNMEAIIEDYCDQFIPNKFMLREYLLLSVLPLLNTYPQLRVLKILKDFSPDKPMKFITIDNTLQLGEI